MAGKKGIFFLGPVVMKILIAVIVISLLVGLMATLIGIVMDRNKIEQARANLNNILQTINDMDVGEIKEVNLQGIKGNGKFTYWSLIGYNLDEPIRPTVSECYGNSCICFCGDIEYGNAEYFSKDSEVGIGLIPEPVFFNGNFVNDVRYVDDAVRLKRANKCKNMGICLPIKQKVVDLKSVITYSGSHGDFERSAPRIILDSGGFKTIKIIKDEDKVEIIGEYFPVLN